MRKRAVIRPAVAVCAVGVLGSLLLTGCKVQLTAPGATPSATKAPAAPHRTPGATTRPRPEPPPREPAPRRPAQPAEPAPPNPRPLLMAAGASGTSVRELQARLRELGLFDRHPTGYYGSVTAAAVRDFQLRYATAYRLARTGTVDTATWGALRTLTRPPSQAVLHPPTSRPLAQPDPRCLSGRVLCVSKRSSTLAWMVDGRVVSAMDVRFGAQYTPTREGTFHVYFKSRHHFSTLYRTPMPYALFFSGGQAVHYSADFAARGYGGASHGCVNVRDAGKIAALFAQVRVGDKVVVYW
ncbi:L,D-transpeptidase family protein [Streptomyces pathocidini]|uniref:L,D-transpeptidase family protein n=1 Tax=Streptomyces pathocidini TaxID=1650571 RepID=UPI003402CDA6